MVGKISIRRAILPTAFTVLVGGGVAVLYHMLSPKAPKGSVTRQLSSSQPELPPDINNIRKTLIAGEPLIKRPSKEPIVSALVPGKIPMAAPDRAHLLQGEAERIRKLGDMHGRDILRLDDIDFNPYHPEAAQSSNRDEKCREVYYKNGDFLGYINLSTGLSDLAQNPSIQPYTLAEVFFHGDANIYYEVIDLSSGIPLGKVATYFDNRDVGYVTNIVWNDGREAFFINKNGFLYPSSRDGNWISSYPIWSIDISIEDLGSDRLRDETIVLLENPSIRLRLGSYKDGYSAYLRLRESCADDAKRLLQFLEITNDNFAAFVRMVFSLAGR